MCAKITSKVRETYISCSEQVSAIASFSPLAFKLVNSHQRGYGSRPPDCPETAFRISLLADQRCSPALPL